MAVVTCSVACAALKRVITAQVFLVFRCCLGMILSSRRWFIDHGSTGTSICQSEFYNGEDL